MHDERNDSRFREVQKIINSSDELDLIDDQLRRGDLPRSRVHNRYFLKRIKSKKNDEPGGLFGRRR